MDKEAIEGLLNSATNDIKYVEVIANDIVKSRTKDLDDIMHEINEKIVNVDNPSDEIIEKYFLELTNAVYFINAHCEYLGFYEDITKVNAKMKYNQAYSDNQLKAVASNVKATVADNQLAAENASLNETLVNLIYSRSYKIIKVKVEAAEEQIKTLSKILSAHMTEKNLAMYPGTNTNAEVKGEEKWY